ncbi:hypothetical protein [Micromonospora sp. NPDC005367]|uniref:hypothetical protein n=1 Tax=Micromonospora sp. NPDC005367 TaxID=3155590 RepID=UPI0033AA05DF
METWKVLNVCAKASVHPSTSGSHGCPDRSAERRRLALRRDVDRLDFLEVGASGARGSPDRKDPELTLDGFEPDQVELNPEIEEN